jgi:hypothetical protein
MIKNKRSIRILPSVNQIHKVEDFIEKICDDYHIFNSYYGIILFSVEEIFRTVALQSRAKPDILRIDFSSSHKGLMFTFYIGEGILEIGSMIQQDITLSEKDADDNTQQLHVVNMLCDDLVIDAEKGVLTILFNIVSINQHLALERNKALEQYYNQIHQTSKV